VIDSICPIGAAVDYRPIRDLGIFIDADLVTQTHVKRCFAAPTYPPPCSLTVDILSDSDHRMVIY